MTQTILKSPGKTYSVPSKKHQVYLASPWFTPDQAERLTNMENLLDRLGVTYFSPRKNIVCPPTATAEQRKAAFKQNEDGIQQAELVLAITDTKDVGTIWEMGYAHGINVPVIGVALTLGDAPFNLMLAESCLTTCRTMEEVEEFFTTGKTNYYQGEIE